MTGFVCVHFWKQVFNYRLNQYMEWHFFLDIISIKLSLFPTMGILTTRRSICKICLEIRFRSHWAKANAKYFHACCISVWLPFKLRRTIFRGIRFFSLSVKKDYVIEKLELFLIMQILSTMRWARYSSLVIDRLYWNCLSVMHLS